MNLIFDLDKILFKKIRQTILFNKKTIDFPGKKFFYSPETTKLTFCLLTMFVILFIYFAITDHNKFFFVAIAFSYLPINMFHKVIFKNPIFIINGDKLYYTKTDKWYDLNESMIYIGNVGKINYSGTLIIDLGGWDNRIEENLWYIEYDKDLIKLIQKYLKKQGFLD